MKTAIESVVVLAVFLNTLSLAGCGDNALADPDAAPDASTQIIDAAPIADAQSATPDAPGAMLACSFEELQPVFACAQQQCSTDLSLTCVLTKCGLLLLGLSPTCQQCVLALAMDPTSAGASCISGM
jgi:predicted small lipoprotein YifL